MNKQSSYPVNLPKTNFDMRAGLVKKEPIILEQWKTINLYQKRLAEHNNRVKFILHDGPPYANGDIHIGTALNKILKDVICRYKYMQGFEVHFVPGWDCHGLPIEQNTLKSLRKNLDTLTTIEIQKNSREYAEKFVNKQKESFIRLGISADWDNPYLTMSNDYEASIVEVCGKLAGQGYIYRGQRPIYWSPESRSALADAEVEYHKHTSPTVYVLFPINNSAEMDLPEHTYVMIWTTTPWTLPANVAVAFHPNENYEAVTLDSGITIIIGSKLKNKILALTDAVEKKSKIIPQEKLVDISVKHPWIDRISHVVYADYVTMEDGTGIVHTAPGHGTEDYQTGLKYNLDILSPVDDQACFTDEVPEWKGLKVFDANPKIIEFLKEKKLLYFTSEIVHSYPHDWRTKTPVIFRTKPQWFFKVSDLELSKKAISSLETVKWIPSWGQQRMKNMLENRADWCISRQRKWGVPIPAFYCCKCEHAILTECLAQNIADSIRKEGLKFWFENKSEDILPLNFSCPNCYSKEFRKEEDILDVWFDSGTSHYAVLDKVKHCPADLYFEGNDQYRGWFQASLWNSIGIHNHPPFKTVLTHGWVLDEHGHQMHKSAGNSVAPSEITDKFGADILRLWTVTEDYSKDLRIGENIIQKTIDLYRKLRNTFRYLLGTLCDFQKNELLDYKELRKLDQFMLHKLGQLKINFKTHMDHYQFHKAYREIFNFAIIDLSGEYFDILKDRLYIMAPKDPLRKSAQTTLYYILEELNLMLAPVLVFTSEEIYQHQKFSDDQKESVHLLSYEKRPEEWINNALAKDFELLHKIRENAMKELQILRNDGKIGSSLDADIYISCNELNYRFCENYIQDLTEMLIISDIILIKNDQEEIKIHGEVALRESKQKCDRCWKIKENITNNICHSCKDIINKF